MKDHYDSFKFGERECNQAKFLIGLDNPDQPLCYALESLIMDTSKAKRKLIPQFSYNEVVGNSVSGSQRDGFLSLDVVAALVTVWKSTPEGMEWCHRE